MPQVLHSSIKSNRNKTMASRRTCGFAPGSEMWEVVTGRQEGRAMAEKPVRELVEEMETGVSFARALEEGTGMTLGEYQDRVFETQSSAAGRR